MTCLFKVYIFFCDCVDVRMDKEKLIVEGEKYPDLYVPQSRQENINSSKLQLERLALQVKN